MGGAGSGSWERQSTKARVDDCLCLPVERLIRLGVIRPGATGSLDWRSSPDGVRCASIGYSVLPRDDGLLLVLTYRVNQTLDIAMPIVMETTAPHFGGERWWFLCPLAVDGVPCRRRVAKLYLDGRYFGCR